MYIFSFILCTYLQDSKKYLTTIQTETKGYYTNNKYYRLLLLTLGTSGNIGNGWASVLNTYLSKLISESSQNMRYKYFRVSARKKLCCTSSFEEFSL